MRTFLIQQLTDECLYINGLLKPASLEIYINTRHVVDRIVERDILVGDIKYALRSFIHKHLCLFVYEEHLPESLRPFKIDIVTKDTVICLNRMDAGLWRFSTVLDPTLHNQKPCNTNWKQTYRV